MTDRRPSPAKQERARRSLQAQRRQQAGKIALGILIVAAIGAGAYGLTLIPDQPKNVHWHPTWEVYVNDENVRWGGSRDFDMSGMGMGIHLHQPNDDTIHAESRSDRLTLGGLLLRLGGELRDEGLQIPSPATNAGTYAATADAPLRVFTQAPGDEWIEIESDFAGLVLADQLRILVTYAPSADALHTQQDSVAGPPTTPSALPSVAP